MELIKIDNNPISKELIVGKIYRRFYFEIEKRRYKVVWYSKIKDGRLVSVKTFTKIGHDKISHRDKLVNECEQAAIVELERANGVR